MNIFPSLNPPIGAIKKPDHTPAAPDSSGKTIGDTFNQLLEDANQQQLLAEDKKKEFLTSPEKDIHGTMLEMEKAEISLRLLLQVRGKLTSAYEEVMRMQI